MEVRERRGLTLKRGMLELARPRALWKNRACLHAYFLRLLEPVDIRWLVIVGVNYIISY